MSFTFPSSPTLNQQYSVSGGPTYTWNGTAWIVLTPGQQFNRQAYTATANQTSFSVSTGYLVGGLDVFRNGVKLLTGTDYTATNGSTFTLILPANNGDTVECICYSQILYSDALRKTGDTMTGNLIVPNITANSSVIANNGLYSSNNYTGSYTDGIVVDYVTGNGRISVGSGDGLTIYNGGVANTALVTLNSSGNLTFNAASSLTCNNNTTISAVSTKSLSLNGGGGSNGLVIDANNNVGIGTATIDSTAKLHIYSTGLTYSFLESTSAVGWAANVYKTTGTIYELGARGPSASPANSFYVYDRTAAAFRLLLDSNGNFALGIVPNGVKLNVTNGGLAVQGTPAFPSTGAGWEIVSNTSTNTNSIQSYNRNTSSWMAASWYAYNHTWNTNNGNSMSLDLNGNLNLGGNTPVSNSLRYFDLVNGDSGASAGAIMRFITMNVANTAATTVDVVKYRSGGFIINNNDSSASNYTSFGVGGVERARINSSGDVIVGTAALSTTATAGFPWIPSCAGTPTGAATPPYSGASGLVVDSTNSRLYVKSGSNWVSTNIGNTTSTGIYSNYSNIASFTPSANATDWYRIVAFSGSNQPSFVRLHISMPGVHFQCLVDISRGAGGDFVQTQFKLLGNYVYWGQYPMDWRLVPTGTNLPLYLEVRFSAYTTGSIQPMYISVLESITTDSGHPTFPCTNVGTATAGYGIRIGTTSGFTYPEFKIRPGVWAREDYSFVRTTGTVASGAVQT